MAAVIGVGLVPGSACVADAEVEKKIVVVKPAQKVVVARPSLRSYSNRNRNIGLGVAAAVVGTAIAIEAARANDDEHHYNRGSGMSCPALERRCDGC